MKHFSAKKYSPLSDIAAGEFSWSCARHNLFNFCRRAYFYHYYGAAGGWDNCSDEPIRHLYILKNIRKSKLWLNGILSSALRRLLTGDLSGRKYSAKEFHGILKRETLRSFYRDRADILNREWKKDPKKANIFELYYRIRDTGDFFDEAQAKLESCTNKFCDSDIFAELLSIPLLELRAFRLPLAFECDGIKIWSAPDIIRVAKGICTVFRIKISGLSSDGNADSSGLNAAVCRLAASCLSGISAEKTECASLELPYDGSEGLKCSYLSMLPEDARGQIGKSSGEMLSFVSPDGRVYENEFSGTAEDDEHVPACSECVFFEYCCKPDAET